VLNRVQSLNNLIKKEVSQILLRGLDLPDNVLATITQVETSSNIIQTKVYISVIPVEKTDEVFQILKKEIYEIQQKLNKRLKMRPVPKIIFTKEEKTREAGKIEEILEKIKDDIK